MIGTALWVAIWPYGNPVAGWILFALGMVGLVVFVRRVIYYFQKSHMELYLNPTI
jgi:hypothetical protein